MIKRISIAFVVSYAFVVCSGARKFHMEKARETVIILPATFDQIFRHSYRQLDEFTRDNESKVDLARAAAFFAAQISVPASDESAQVAEERRYLLGHLSYQLYALIKDEKIWWKEFADASQPAIKTQLLNSLDPITRDHLLKERKQLSVRNGSDCDYESMSRDCYVSKVDQHRTRFSVRFALMTRSEWGQFATRYHEIVKNFSTRHDENILKQKVGVATFVTYDTGNAKYEEFTEIFPFDWAIFTNAGWQWWNEAQRQTGEKQKAAYEMAGYYAKRGQAFVPDGTYAQSQISLLEAATIHVLGSALFAKPILDKQVNVAHLDSNNLEFFKKLKADVDLWEPRERKAAEARVAEIERASGYQNSGNAWTYTSNPAPGSGPGNSNINLSTGTESYTDSHGNKVYKTR